MNQKSWMFFSTLALSQVLFAELASQDTFKQGEPLTEGKYPGAYNAPAAISLNPSLAGPLNHIGLEASFLYWNATEEGLDLATSATMVQLNNSSFQTAFTSNGKVLRQSFEYQPGFNVGIEAGMGQWLLEGEYTWIRQTTQKSKEAPIASFGTGVWNVRDWFQQTSSTGQQLAGTRIGSKWHLAIDLADLYVKRPAYQGKHLLITPLAGLRTLWIRQTLDISLTEQERTRAFLAPQPIHSYNRSNSWAIGPRGGMEASWLFSKGFRLEGDLSVSLLATNYTTLYHSEEAASSNTIPSQLSFSMNNYKALRTFLEMSLGFGWGTYFYGEAYAIDFLASYDFSAYYNQNMMRTLMDQVVSGASTTSDLYLQGLTLKASFSF